MKAEPRNLKEWIQLYTDKYNHLSNKEILDLYHLDLTNLKIKEISLFLNNFKGNIDLGYNQIKEIPTNFRQNGPLFLNNNQIKKIPKNFIQNRTLYLNNNQIKEIPKNFKQNGYLDLSYNQIKEISINFQQNGSLDFYSNFIETIHSPELLDEKTLKEIIKHHKQYIEKRERKKHFIDSLKL